MSFTNSADCLFKDISCFNYPLFVSKREKWGQDKFLLVLFLCFANGTMFFAFSFLLSSNLLFVLFVFIFFLWKMVLPTSRKFMSFPVWKQAVVSRKLRSWMALTSAAHTDVPLDHTNALAKDPWPSLWI